MRKNAERNRTEPREETRATRPRGAAGANAASTQRRREPRAAKPIGRAAPASLVTRAIVVAAAVGALVACSGASATDLFDPSDSAAGGGAPSTLDAGGGASHVDSGGGSGGNEDAGRGGSGDAGADAGTGGEKDATPPPVDAAPTDPGVVCGDVNGKARYCAASSEVCCVGPSVFGSPPTYACATDCTGNDVKVECDDGADCASGICCGHRDNRGAYVDVTCSDQPCDTQNGEVRFCNPKGAAECGQGTCVASKSLPGYSVCQ